LSFISRGFSVNFPLMRKPPPYPHRIVVVIGVEL
jgi:hypothetical protein